MFDKLKIEGNNVSDNCEICEVEVFEKASPEEFYDQSGGVELDEECELESLDSVDDNDNVTVERRSQQDHVETTSIGTEMNRDEHLIPLDTGQQNTAKASEDCKSNLVKNVKISTNPSTRQKFDPLENFLALRCKKNKMAALGNVLTESRNIPTEVQKLPAVQDPPPEKLQEELTKPSTRPISVKTKKTKHHLVTVKQSDAYRSLVAMLDKEATRYLSVLKTDNAVPKSCSFQTLTPDVTRFLVKQREKYHADNSVDASEDSVYRSILCVHGLVGTAEILVTYCLESALGFMNAFYDRYQHAVKNSLDSIHQGLLQCREKFNQKQILHPKLSAICKEIETWLKKKRTKSGDNEQKILVIVKKDMLSLKNSLKRVLNLSKLLDPHVLETADANLLIESLDDHNCLIVHTQQIAETFPWAQFSLVVEYEYQEAANWKDHCERQNIRHMALVMEQDCAEDASNGDRQLDVNKNDKPISVIASQHVTSNSTLLQLLESRFNIQLYERDYSLLKLNPSLAFSDVDVNENTAILIEDVGKLREDRSLHSVVTRIVSLSLKYTTCYCLFYKDKASSTGYLYPSHVIANIGKLQAAAVNFERRSKSNYNAKILLCPDMNEMAVIIRKICEERLTSSVDMSVDNALDRSWLSTDITKEEKFLLQNPCISSFNAQVLLNAVGLKGILAGNFEQLTEAVPGIANTTLMGICESIKQVRDNIPLKSATNDVVSRHSIPDNALTNQIPTSNNNSDAMKAVHKATRSHIQAEGTEQQRDKYTQPRDGPEHDTHIERIASMQHHRKDSDKYNGYHQDSGTKDNFNRKHGESMNSSSTEKRQINLYDPKKDVDTRLQSDESVNDTETPSSHDFASLMQHPGGDRENTYQNLIQTTSGRSQLMAMKQGLRASTPSKKARRHLEFEPIGLSEVERSFRQQFGSGRTPLKIDSRPNISHPDMLKSEANRPNTSQPEMQKSEATCKQDRERLRDLPIDPRDQHFPFSDLRRLEQQLDRRDTSNDNQNIIIHQTLDPKFYADKENTVPKTTEPFTKPAVVQTTSLYQNVVGQSVQTFDYNHGIPKQQESTVTQRNDAAVIAKPGVTRFCNNTDYIKQHHSQENYTSSNMPHRQRFLDSRTAFDMEYPPADQIDRLVCESNHNTKMFPESRADWNNVKETYPSSGRENMYDYTNTFSRHHNGKAFPEVGNDKFKSPYPADRYSSYDRVQNHASNHNADFTTHQYLHSPMPKQDLIRYLNTPNHFPTDHDIPTALQPLSQNSVDLTREQAHPSIDKSVRFSDGLFQRPTMSTNSEPYGNYNGAINDSPFNNQNMPCTLQILPQATDPLTEQNTQKKKINSNKTFFNPCMERLTLRPMCIPAAADTVNTVNNPNMEDANSQEAFMRLLQYSQQLPSYLNMEDVNSQEAFMRLLQYSQQLPRFGCVASRYPIQRKSIGLAQPLQRTKVADDNKIRQDNTQTSDQNQTRDHTSNQTSNQTRQAENQMREEHHRDSQQTNNTVNHDHTSREKENVRRRNSDPAPMWSSEERRRMLQSPFAIGDSPPMDIDYEDSQVNRILHSNNDSQKFSNRCVFTGATPDKKRRLSYEKIPGRKGQTKLIFQ